LPILRRPAPLAALFIPALLSRPVSPLMVVLESPGVATAQGPPHASSFSTIDASVSLQFRGWTTRLPTVPRDQHQRNRDIRLLQGVSFASAPRPFLLAARASDLEELFLFSELTFSILEIIGAAF